MIKFNHSSSFTPELKSEVEKYFAENKISKKGTSALYFKTVFWITLTVVCYVILVFLTPVSNALSLTLCALLGFSFAGIGFNIMHDAAHGSYSEKKWVNKLWARSLDAVGASSDIWDPKHNTAHHSFPNTDHDDDINVSPLLRMSKNQKWHWWYIPQILYMWVLYAIEYLGWVLIFDFKKYFARKVCETKIRFTRSNHWFFWISKIMYFFIFIGLPMIIVGVGTTIIGYLIVGGVCGLTISVVFQLAHIQEKSSFPIATKTNKEGVFFIENENAIHQLATTANFATENKVISWLLGGLNFQVEHHLFPGISHVHYPKIHKIVKRVCRKYNVEYKEYKTFIGALISHIKHMGKMSVA